MSANTVRIQLRRDTAANWTSANPVLAQGEEGVETDSGFKKRGDGTSAWSSLGYCVESPSVAIGTPVELGDGITLDTTDPDAPVLEIDPDDPPWIYVGSGDGIAPPFLNAASNLGSGFAPAAFRLMSDGTVQMKGHVVCSSTTVFTLPSEDYCPADAMILDATIAPTPGQLIIYPNGSVEFNQAPTGFGTLNASFPTS